MVFFRKSITRKQLIEELEKANDQIYRLYKHITRLNEMIDDKSKVIHELVHKDKIDTKEYVNKIIDEVSKVIKERYKHGNE